MKKLSFKEPADFLALIVRRKWWMAGAFGLLFPAIVLVAWLLPGIFVSETLILIEPRDVPDDFVKNLITVDTEERLSAIQETVLSRTNLLRVLNEFAPLRKGGRDDQSLIEALRKQISIEFQERRNRDRSPVYFKIAYENRDPALAQRVTSRLASLFIEHDSRNREDQVFGTAEFLNTELQKVATQLSEVESTLRVQKERYRYELPEQLDTNLRTLDRLQEQFKANTEALDRYVSLRLSLDREIALTPPTVTKEVGRTETGTAVARPSELIETYRRKKLEMEQLAAKYTDKHPDVGRLKEEVARLESQIPPEDLKEAAIPVSQPITTTAPNPVYLKLTAQLDEVKTEISIREKERIWIQNEIAKLNGRIQSTPQREQDIAGSQRERDELMKQYEELKAKLADARLAESLESKQKGSQFLILDPANFPLTPAKPNRPLIVLVGLFGALAIGVCLAVAADVFDQKVWTHADLERSLGIPVLAEIPEILSTHNQRRTAKRKKLEIALASLFLVVLATGFVGIYLSPSVQAAITQQLDKMTALLNRR